MIVVSICGTEWSKVAREPKTDTHECSHDFITIVGKCLHDEIRRGWGFHVQSATRLHGRDKDGRLVCDVERRGVDNGHLLEELCEKKMHWSLDQ